MSTPSYHKIGTVDLIDERDRKAKMSKTLIKGYNVLYMTKEQAEKMEQEKEKKEKEKQEKEKQEKDLKNYNAATGSYSGTYGQGEVSDMARRMLEELQSEKDALFDSVIAEAKE